MERKQYTNASTQNVREALALAADMTILADNAEEKLTDDGCRVLYGIIRDCAEKIRKQGEIEKETHKARGMWR
jgi:hypothetical protein